jgi:hypothetical protein
MGIISDIDKEISDRQSQAIDVGTERKEGSL